MTDADIAYYSSQAMLLMLWLSLPAIVTATLVGLLVGLFQALTQIQEQTLSFGLKLIAVVLVLAATARWVGVKLYNFTIEMFDTIPLVPP